MRLNLQAALNKIAAHYGNTTTERKQKMHATLVERFGEDFDETHEDQADEIIVRALSEQEYGELAQSTLEDLQQWIAFNYLD